jgi:hypothetical protein
MTAFTKVVYALLGTFAVVAAAVALVWPELALPPGLALPMVLHLVREQAALFIFIGLMFFWCLTHYEQRGPVHLALLAFIVVFAGVHWLDYVSGRAGIVGPLINTIPVALIAVTMPFGRR